MTTAVLCPRCKQDSLRHWLLEPTSEQIAVCPECDATWLLETTPSATNFTDYESFLAARGLDYFTKQIRLLQ